MDHPRIVLVEPDALAADLYQAALTREGFRTLHLPSAPYDPAKVRAFNPDLLVIDLARNPNRLPPHTDEPTLLHNPAPPLIALVNPYLAHSDDEPRPHPITAVFPKARCSAPTLVRLIRQTLGPQRNTRPEADGALPSLPPSQELRARFAEHAQPLAQTVRTLLQFLIKTPVQSLQTGCLQDLHDQIHNISSAAAAAGWLRLAQLTAALEALVRELGQKPDAINPSTLRSLTHAVDTLGQLLARSHELDWDTAAPSILVVDDEPLSRRAVVLALQRGGLSCRDFPAAEPALEACRHHRFDLVLLDIDMPEMNGFDACTALHHIPGCERVPVIFVTALTDFESRARSVLSGGNELIAKPFLFPELGAKAVTHLLKHQLAVPSIQSSRARP